MKSNFKIFPPTFEIVEEEPPIRRSLSKENRLYRVSCTESYGLWLDGLTSIKTKQKKIAYFRLSKVDLKICFLRTYFGKSVDPKKAIFVIFLINRLKKDFRYIGYNRLNRVFFPLKNSNVRNIEWHFCILI